MLRRKARERTTEDAPDTIAPWELLEDSDIAALTARIQPRYPDQTLKVFARRQDNDLHACFVMGENGKATGVVVVPSGGGRIERTYPSFTAWFDDALREAGMS